MRESCVFLRGDPGHREQPDRDRRVVPGDVLSDRAVAGDPTVQLLVSFETTEIAGFRS